VKLLHGAGGPTGATPERGKRMFGCDAEALAFTLAQSVSTPGGARITRYVRAGNVHTATWGTGE
jgi:hypothetical protein